MHAPHPHRPALHVARWSAAHPVRALAGWLIAILACVALGQLIGTVQAGGSDFRVGEAGRAEALATGAGIPDPAVERVLVTGGTAELRRSAADRVDAAWSSLPGVARTLGPRPSRDGTAMLVGAELRGAQSDATRYVPRMDAAVERVRADAPGLRLERTGTATIAAANSSQLGSDLIRAELMTLPVTLLVLFVVFASLLAAATPVILAISSVAAAMGLYGAASLVFPDAGGAVANVVLLIGMALGVDYSLFYVARVREERRRSGGTIDHRRAVELAATTAGHSIVVSAIAVVASLVGLYFVGDVIFSSIATGSILVVVTAALSSLTALPALLALLGRRADRRRERRDGPDPIRETDRASALVRPALRRPIVVAVAVTTLLLALGAPVLGLSLRVEGNDTFPRSIPAIAAYERMTGLYPDTGAAHRVVVRAPAGEADRVERRLATLAAEVSRLPGIARAAHMDERQSADGTVTTIAIPLSTGPNDSAAVASLTDLRQTDLPRALAGVPGATGAVTGETARSIDYATLQGARAPIVIGWVLLATVVVMGFAFRSIVVGVLAAIFNSLSAVAALGALVAVFQTGVADAVLETDSGGFVSSRIPLIVFAILFGISMDYQVLILSRIREAAQRGEDRAAAISTGIGRSAALVTSAAVVMISVFATFLFVGLVELKQIGFGLAFAVLVDVLLVRLLLTPAVLMLVPRLFGTRGGDVGGRRTP